MKMSLVIPPQLDKGGQMYRFKIGDKVCHNEYPAIVGTITKRLSYDEEMGEPVNKVNPKMPWYNIKWNRGPSITFKGQIEQHDAFDGFEHDGVLLPVDEIHHRRLLLLSQILHGKDKSLWEKCWKKVRGVLGE